MLIQWINDLLLPYIYGRSRQTVASATVVDVSTVCFLADSSYRTTISDASVTVQVLIDPLPSVFASPVDRQTVAEDPDPDDCCVGTSVSHPGEMVVEIRDGYITDVVAYQTQYSCRVERLAS